MYWCSLLEWIAAEISNIYPESGCNVTWPGRVCGFVSFTKLKPFTCLAASQSCSRILSLLPSCWLPISGLFALLIIRACQRTWHKPTRGVMCSHGNTSPKLPETRENITAPFCWCTGKASESGGSWCSGSSTSAAHVCVPFCYPKGHQWNISIHKIISPHHSPVRFLVVIFSYQFKNKSFVHAMFFCHISAQVIAINYQHMFMCNPSFLVCVLFSCLWMFVLLPICIYLTVCKRVSCLCLLAALSVGGNC